jgi:hypothetical protein
VKDGKGFVFFDSIESATAAMQAVDGAQTANGEKIVLEYAKPLRKGESVGDDGSTIDKPNERLFFSGCTSNVSDIRTLFQEFSASLKDIYLCMLFILSDSVPTNSHGVSLNSE